MEVTIFHHRKPYLVKLRFLQTFQIFVNILSKDIGLSRVNNEDSGEGISNCNKGIMVLDFAREWKQVRYTFQMLSKRFNQSSDWLQNMVDVSKS